MDGAFFEFIFDGSLFGDGFIIERYRAVFVHLYREAGGIQRMILRGHGLLQRIGPVGDPLKKDNSVFVADGGFHRVGIFREISAGCGTRGCQGKRRPGKLTVPGICLCKGEIAGYAGVGEFQLIDACGG